MSEQITTEKEAGFFFFSAGFMEISKLLTIKDVSERRHFQEGGTQP